MRFVRNTKGVALGYDKYGRWPTISIEKAHLQNLRVGLVCAQWQARSLSHFKVVTVTREFFRRGRLDI